MQRRISIGELIYISFYFLIFYFNLYTDVDD